MSEKKIHKSHLSIRLNILFFVVFLLFSALILRLGVVQIVQGEEFQNQLENEVSVSQEVEAPRGLMYDRYGNLLVDNKLQLTVTYTNRNRPQEELLATAADLNEFITLDTEGIESRYERDRREYWALLNPEEFEEKLTLEQQNQQELSDGEAHTQRIEAITQEELGSFSEEELEVFMIWREFNSGYNDVPHKVLRGVEYEEAAQIMEHMEYLPGVDIIRDSTRRYVYGDHMSSIFGRVGSIPRDDLSGFLAKGYQRNDEVGNSYLEAQYENVLRGRNGSLENYTDQSGNIIRSPEEEPGSRGNDLMLTFDMELQQRVSEIIDEVLEDRSSDFIADPDAYVVMMEPDTGEVLSMAGGSSDLGTFTQGYVVGSSMKGATVLAGYDTGVLPPGSGIYDRPINLPGSQPIRSVNQLGYVDDLTALERSSNIYMVEVAMRLVDYVPGVSGRNWGNYTRGYDILRSYYQQFGLGVETGIDLPSEFAGINGGIIDPGSMLFLSFGQFDTYTPMQLAQYVSTIANDGVRIAPRVVSEIIDPDPQSEEWGTISHQFEPEVLNIIDVDQTYFDRIKTGFHRVINGNQGTARAYFNNLDVEMAGKTGTAQVTVNGEEAHNQTFVGFGPYEDPEVAFSVVAPGVDTDSDAAGIANTIAERAAEAYFELKEEREGPQQPEDGAEIIDPEEETEN
ncbi:penicillin-binding transpeptidase domain-containing protein [Alkalicoccus daliensis]|uniref:serine-type D-Ala-D-Ala carboxypeptidase n=1 Tax=Alkalicoccus daliensis TaxID=745820 RepID=A0A1H0B8S2_9BACI|nr:penicillin-binding transpeptidase domain-containing protein [Alkalicoccus daliensis]SDN42045.1 cell elongation-specific peptidoglycan D,D-transpeptidase [Alkalicoccus daliensis]